MLTVENLIKSYRRNADVVRVLQGLDLTVADGEFVSIVGASGSGKSTLLHLMGTLDAPDSGVIRLDGRRIDNLPRRDRDVLRNRTFGFIFQFYHLLPELTALDNVLMPAYVGQSVMGWMRTRREWRRRGEALLNRVGLGHRLQHKPRELSGGEMQRAAVARALLLRPRVLLADEPTGNLDAETGLSIVNLLKELNRDDGVTVVMVTHNLELAAGTDRVVRMHHGRVADRPVVFPEPLLAAGV
ncbi:MAG: ABC transporter ATP-binding protein [Fimbriiglobus sp.]